MSTPADVIFSTHLGGNHSIELVRMAGGQRGSFAVDEFLNEPIATAPTLTCPTCGTSLTVPDGNLKEHIVRQLPTIRQDQATRITFRIRHRGSPSSTAPQGRKLTPEEIDAFFRQQGQ